MEEQKNRYIVFVYIQRLGQALDRPRAVAVSPRLERILALQFQERSNLHQNLGHFVFVHADEFIRRRQRFHGLKISASCEICGQPRAVALIFCRE